MMKKYAVLLFMIWSISQVTWAQEVTYNQDIGPIIYENCTTCHRPGEIGPFPMTRYDEVASWANMIKHVTSTRYMPPWPPDRVFSHFQKERFLTDEEILKISNWADAGAPEGDGATPQLPDFPSGSQLGEPDLVLSFAEKYTHQGINEDEYRVFVLPTNLPEDKQIKAIELRPGNRRIVHHALFTYDSEGIARQLDAATPDYGYQSFGGFGQGLEFAILNQYPGYVPGQESSFYPKGLGQVLPAGADILIQVHYAPIPVEQDDSSTVNIFFADEDDEIDRAVQNILMTPFTAIGDPGMQSLILPADEVTRYHYRVNIPVQISVYSVTPHMHLLGRNWEVYADLPDGSRLNLIQINDWDFNWQGSYNYPKFQIVPPSSVIHAYAIYDNTVDNPQNPNNPPQVVTWGEFTTDEMFYLPVTYVPYRDGDEDIDLTQSGVVTASHNPVSKHEDILYPAVPNPVKEEVEFRWKLHTGRDITMEIFSMEGKSLRKPVSLAYYPDGEHSIKVDMRSFDTGTYFVNLKGDGLNTTQIFQKF